jgi:hypothetical protein
MMPDWIYHQSTGDIFYTNGVVAPVERGYSGYGSLKNDPDMQGVSDLGPIPRGEYTIGAFVDIHGGNITNAVPLTPAPGNEMFGRSGFFVHGFNNADPGGASQGCIILTLPTRKKMVDSRPAKLIVVRGP